nr:hypothetical protein [Tanacetum cinerariifolium]
MSAKGLESKVMRECCFVVERDAWLRGEFTLSSLDVLQGFSFFLQMGLTLILATIDGLDVGLLGDVIVYPLCIEQFWATVKAKTINREVPLQALVDGKKILITESTLTLMGFVQVFLNNQLEGMSNHNRIYVTPSHTKKIFGNMKKVGKGFSRKETSLFPTMMVQAQEEMGKGLENPTDPYHIPTIIQQSTSQPQKTKQHRKPKRKVTEVPQPSDPIKHVVDKAINEEMDDSLERDTTTATSLDAKQDKCGDPRVLDLETTKTTQDLEIDSLKMRVKKLERRKRSRTHRLKRLYMVGLLARVESSEDEGLGEEDASKHGRIADVDANEDIYLVNIYNDEDMFGVNDLDGDEVIVECVDVREQAKEFIDDITLAKALIEIKSAKPKADKVKNKGKGKMVEPKHVKKLSKKDQTELVLEGLKKAEAEVTEGSSKRVGEELEQENAKKQKMEDDKESVELKQCLEIISDNGDDVTIDATPLSSKSPTIVDYKIHKEGKKNYF